MTPANRPRLRLRREACQVPITALAFCETRTGPTFLLAGEDTDLTVYDVDSTTLRGRLTIFAEQPIHGIRVQRDIALSWGAKSLAVVHVTEEGTPRLRAAAGSASDWIYDAAASPWDACLAVAVTAHNEVLPFTWRDGGQNPARIHFGLATSPSRPMLYAARAQWLAPERVLVVGGTVFGDLVVWEYRFGAAAQPARALVLAVLSGHEGSVYGLDISPEVTISDGSTARLLASCSDDRTIRIWRMKKAREGLAEFEGAASDATSTSTGFRSEENVQEGGPGDGLVRAADSLVAVAMGHASRIWGVKFGGLSSCALTEGSLPVYTFGEDATAQRWRLAFDAADQVGDGKARLVHEQSFASHDGKHVWAHAILRRDNSAVIATGGGDGAISLIEDPVADPTAGLSTFDVLDMQGSTSLGDCRRKHRDIISRYDFVLEDCLVVTTTHGRLFVGRFETTWSWEEVAVNDCLVAQMRHVYVLRTVSRGAAMLGTTDGHVLFFQLPDKLSRITQVPGRVVEIHCLSTREDRQGECSAEAPTLNALVHLHGRSDSRYLKLDGGTGRMQSSAVTRGVDSRFVATSAARLDDMLILGSRHGWLSLLRWHEDAWCPVLAVATRSRDSITAVVPLPSRQDPRKPSAYFVATSRDGQYRIYQVEHQDDASQLQLVHETSLPFGPMVEGGWLAAATLPDLVLYGFRGKQFVVWNETRREEVAHVDCGGAHRTFRVHLEPSSAGRCRMAFTRASTLCIYHQTRSARGRVKPGAHGREIRALSSNGRYLASGAEDTSVRIWRQGGAGRDGEGRGVQCLAYMKAHVTGLQKLRWSGDEHLFSSAGNEEFYAWRVRELDAAWYGPAVVREGVLDDKSRLGDLRILDFDVGSQAGEGSGLVVTLALSNSKVKSYRYEADGGSVFRPLAEGSYTGACLTQVRHVDVDGDTISILTGSTDGHLVLWASEGGAGSDPQTFHVRQVLQVHQSSIKSLDMGKHGEGEGEGEGEAYAVVTGGDDNALGVTDLRPAGGGKGGGGGWAMTSSVRLADAHAAAVNGVVVLAGQDERRGRLAVSVSNDQRVRAWRWQQDGRGPRSISLVASACSGVADAGDVEEAFRGGGGGRSVVVGGVGMEMWRLEDEEEAP